VVLSGFLIPAFQTRRVDTVVELRDGQSLVIGGLTNTDVRKTRRKIPLLGDIPVLGVFFQNSRDTIEENELVVLVSPRIIRPLEASETPCAAESRGRKGLGRFKAENEPPQKAVRRSMRHFVKKEQGNALILGALSFAVLIGFGVLTIDIGRILVTQNQLQNAADAGALAGASVFCDNFAATDPEVESMVRLVGGNHYSLAMDKPAKVDIPNSQIKITRNVEAGRNEVEVTTKSLTRQYFLNLMKGQGWGGPGGTSDMVQPSPRQPAARPAASPASSRGRSPIAGTTSRRSPATTAA
jgi:hypothetical protein